jgi:hypothetical protein
MTRPYRPLVPFVREVLVKMGIKSYRFPWSGPLLETGAPHHERLYKNIRRTGAALLSEPLTIQKLLGCGMIGIGMISVRVASARGAEGKPGTSSLTGSTGAKTTPEPR